MYKLPVTIMQYVDQYQPISDLSDGTERSVAYYLNARQDISLYPKDRLIYQLNMQGTDIFFAFNIEANEIITEINIFIKLANPNEDIILITSNKDNLKDVSDPSILVTNQLTLYYDSFYFTLGVADVADIVNECFKLLYQLATNNAYWMPSTYYMLGAEPKTLSHAVLLPKGP